MDCCSEYVGRFVERAAHVDWPSCLPTIMPRISLLDTAHGGKTMCSVPCSTAPIGSALQRRRHHEVPSHQDADYRVNQNRRNLFKCFRKFLTCFAEDKDNVACCRKPATSAPRKPEVPLDAIIPPTKPRASAGRSPIAMAM